MAHNENGMNKEYRKLLNAINDCINGLIDEAEHSLNISSEYVTSIGGDIADQMNKEGELSDDFINNFVFNFTTIYSLRFDNDIDFNSHLEYTYPI